MAEDRGDEMVNSPKELEGLRQWICWRLEPDPRSEKPRKVPYDPRTGRRASSTNPDTWGTLEEAQAARDKYMFTGLGFVFTEECGLVGVDIDHCRNEDGSWNECASAILKKWPSYTEVSPSGLGLHIFFRGKMPGKGNKNSTSGVEMYAAARYFTMTGNHLEGTPDSIADGTDALPWIHEAYIVRKKKAKKGKAAMRSVALTDEQVLEKAQGSVNGDDFTALWEGEWQGKYGSQSEADLSLCCSLAFWTGKNREQMDRLFRQSGLFRAKWDSVHHASGATYGEETLEQAIQRTENVYTPGGDLGIYEANGRYIRERGENVYPLTNFVVRPLVMIEAEDETQMICDLVTMYGETFRTVFMTADFVSTQKFKAVLNRHTIALSYYGSDGDLETLKSYISGLQWQKKKGVKAMGLYPHDGRWAYVDQDGGFMAGGEEVTDMVQIGKYASIDSDIVHHDPITAEALVELGHHILRYNEPAKTVTVLSWCAGCYVKEMLRVAGIKYPHLFLLGEAGSGKSTTLERIILPLFGRTKIIAAPQVTGFTIMKDAASSNLFPQALDAYKPSKIDKGRIGVLANHFRDSFDGHKGVRGRADQTQVYYDLLAPLVVAGEESADESSINERVMELLFSKKDLKDPAARASYARIIQRQDDLPALGRALLDTALTVNEKIVAGWYGEGLVMFNPKLDSRIVNNLACCMVGLRLLEAMCARLGLAWGQVFEYGMDDCIRHLEYGVREYLLNGGLSNRSVVELTLDVINRMGLSDEECRYLDGGKVAIHFRGIYDRYTRYRRECDLRDECLSYEEFMKQLKKSDLYLETKVVRFGDTTKKAAVLNDKALRERCDIESFLQAQGEPL